MKRQMLHAVLFSLFTLSMAATKAQKGIYVGVQGAPQLSVMFNNDEVRASGTDYKSKFSYSYGISAGYKFSERMGIGTEVNYSRERQEYVGTNSSYTQKFNYIKVPVLFTYNSDPSSMLVFTAKAGPQVSMLAKSSVSGSKLPAENGNVKDRYRTINYGAMAGVGARLRVSSNMYVDAGLRFDGNFTNAEKSGTGRARSQALTSGVELGLKYFLN